jgi:uncharacterized protein YjiS (DUF1127 family)
MLLIRTLGAPAALKPLGAFTLAALVRFCAWCARCHARAEQRRKLAELDEHLLKDIGVTPAEAAAESSKPWWRA